MQAKDLVAAEREFPLLRHVSEDSFIMVSTSTSPPPRSYMQVGVRVCMDG